MARLIINYYKKRCKLFSKTTLSCESIVKENEAYYQKVIPDQICLPFYDFSTCANAGQLSLEWMRQEFNQPFDPKGSLLQLALLKVSDAHYRIFCKVHHVLMDGWGYSLFYQQVISTYNQLGSGVTAATNYPSYFDFIPEDQKYSASLNYQQDMDFGEKSIASFPSRSFKKRSWIRKATRLPVSMAGRL